jgi:hypothetical protein
MEMAENEDTAYLMHFVEKLFQDSDIWPTEVSRSYLGLIPRIQLLPQGVDKSAIVKLIHLEMVLAAGFIWSRRKKNRYTQIADDLRLHAEMLAEAHAQGPVTTIQTTSRQSRKEWGRRIGVEIQVHNWKFGL